MKPHVWALGLISYAVAIGAAASPAETMALQPANDAGSAKLQDDARLAVKVGLSEKNCPLGELLPDLGTRLKVRLSAAADTADDKVSLFLDGRPAWEVMALLARQFDFEWIKSGSSYQLTQSRASHQREAALRDAEIAPQWAVIEARMRLVARLSGMSREQLAARQNKISQLLGSPNLAPEVRARLTDEQQAIGDLLRPFAPIVVSHWKSLTPAQFQQLRSGLDIHLSTLDHTLPPAMADQVYQAFAERDKNSSWKPDPEHRQADAIVRLTDFTGPRYSPKTASDRPLRLEIGFTSGDQNGYAPGGWFPTFSPMKPEAPIATPTEDPALTQMVALPDAGASRSTGGWPEGLPTLGDLAEALHRATGLEVIADSYIRARLDGKELSAKRPLVQLLDEVKNDLHYTWRKEGNLLLFRDTIYFWDRPAEVPDRVLLPWRRQAAREAGLTLDNLAVLAAALNESRARGLYDFWGWYLEGTPLASSRLADAFYRSRYHLRLWASLTPQQKQASSAHGPLLVTQMSLPQRRAFLQALIARDESVWGAMQVPQDLSAPELMAGAFSLGTRQFQQQTFRITFPSGNSMEFQQVLGEHRPSILDRPGGNGPQPEPVGPATWYDDYTFEYYLAGRETPVLKAPMDLPRIAPAW